MKTQLTSKVVRVMAVGLSLCFGGAIQAQREARWSTDLVSTGVHLDASGIVYFAKQDLTEAQAQTGITVPGDIVGVETNYPHGNSVLVFGRDSSGGRVEHWAQDATSGMYTQQSGISFGADLGSGSYDAVGDKLYILDASTKLIWVNTWDGLSNLPTTGWQVWATKTQVPLLESSSSLYLCPVPAAGNEPFKLFLAERVVRLGVAVEGSVNLYKVNSTLVVEPVDLLGSSPRVEAWFETGSMTEGGSTVKVVGEAGVPFQILGMSNGDIIGSGTLPAAPAGQPLASLFVSVSTPFAIGEDYLVRKVGDIGNPEHARTCMRRYGFPETFADGTRIERIPYTLNFSIGRTSTIYCPLARPSVLQEDLSLFGNVAFAARDSVTGADPVVPLGVNFLLNTGVFLPLSGLIGSSMGEDHTTGFATTDVDIPQDTALVGAVLLFQFWFIDGPNVRLSEVVGLRIDNPDDTPAARSGSGTQTMSLRSRKAQKGRLDAWVVSAIRSKKALYEPSLAKSVIKRRR